MKRDKQRDHWIIDAALFGGFAACLWLDLTGVAAHQLVGLAVAALAGYHLWRHWSWVEAVSSRFLGRTSGRSRACYIVDAGLGAGLATITVTGLVISTWLDLALVSYAAWHAVHVVASVATLDLLVIKIGLHWRWIIDVARRRVFNAPARPATTGTAALAGAAAAAAAANPAAAAGALGRRDFVRLMAGAGAVALLSGANVLGAIKVDEAEGSAGTQASGLPAASSSQSTVAASSCTVRCNRRCSYPGHCRKYTDSNSNGRCDLGECLS